MRTRIAFLFALGVAAPAFAASPRDGRWTIDKACVPIGCFPNDAPGFPVEIATPGAYLLTSDLDVRGESTPMNATAILISARAVDLDLGGFTLQGPDTCFGDPPLCSPGQGDGVGVHALASATGVRVHDGAILGFGAYGVQAESRFALVSDLRLAHMGWTPVYLLGAAGRVDRVVATYSGGSGIYLDPAPGSAVSDSSVHAFNSSGIYTSSACWIVGNELNQQSPAAVGILTGDESVVSENAIRSGSGGLNVGRGALVDHNAINACALGTCSSADWGILLDLGSGYTGNVIYQFDHNWVDGGISLQQNHCHQGGPC
jgi:hypothetical protein